MDVHETPRNPCPRNPTVTILASVSGRIDKADQLEELGLAAREPEKTAPVRVSPSGTWPDYQRCVQDAPMKHGENLPDISRANFMWAIMAAQRGHVVDSIADRLREVSSKPDENGERYRRKMPPAAVERQRGWQRT
jgi:hypothetical protein